MDVEKRGLKSNGRSRVSRADKARRRKTSRRDNGESGHYDVYLDLINVLESDLGRFRPAVANKSALAEIVDARRNGDLVLVLGAGVSVPVRLLNWPQLNEALYRSILPGEYKAVAKGFVKKFTGTAPVLARFIESEIPLKAEFRRRLKQNLYRRYRDRLRNPTIAAIVQLLCGPNARKPVSTVITYNFDNVLELALRHYFPRIKYDSIFDVSGYRASRSRLKIFHPHGFIPLQDTHPYSHLESALVFSEREFHQHYSRADSWQNVVQSYAFSSKTCLFIGISFGDPNLRRHLDLALKTPDRSKPTCRHYAICAVAGGNRSLHSKLLNYFKEKDLTSLGVTPLWVRNFDEIPRVLKLARSK